MAGKQYIWRTVGDSRTRSEHADREGKTFFWTNPPEDGHPAAADAGRSLLRKIRAIVKKRK